MDKKPKVAGENPRKSRFMPSGAKGNKGSKASKGKSKTDSSNPGYHY